VGPAEPRDTRAPDDREASLIRHARDGDTAAFGELVTMHQAAAFRVAYVILGSAADAEDATQEAFVRAYLALDRFREPAPFRPWLVAIVGNEARNRARARGRRAGLAARTRAAMAGGAGTGPAGPGLASQPVAPSPEATVVAGETIDDVHAALATLDEDARQVVTCRYLLGLSEAETAAALGIPPGTAKSRLHRALRRLRERLEAGVPMEPGS
jgi:RNA polymerase sigma factor (sigma-70 family)